MVARLVRDQKVAGSNPVTSTKNLSEDYNLQTFLLFGFARFSLQNPLFPEQIRIPADRPLFGFNRMTTDKGGLMELRVWFRCHFSVRNVHGQKGVEKGRRGGKKGMTQGGFCSLGYGVHTVCRRFKIIGEGLFIFHLCIAPVFISIPVPCEKQHYAGFGVQDTIKILNNSNPYLCARGDLPLSKTTKTTKQLQFPPLREGLRHRPWTAPFQPLFQFPPLREGRPGRKQR